MKRKSQTKNTHGGRREGAGRPNLGKKSKVIRIPDGLPDAKTITDTFELIWEWERKSKDASQTSPRWDKLRQFLSELPSDVLRFD